ncbi:threonine/serine exporter family protein [Plesiomonas shigelloides]|uniref:threonine/serine ThrE exporter family protein n=1 Tax=Plesiomonas shigelloides TaxID=703 RepID=UPI0028846927|nr:threonine/serine exporter family protein [Plesiomonas shigelloides]MDT1010777.1 threonine/serine exporter family protein [Plesiomonas shigelloides]
MQQGDLNEPAQREVTRLCIQSALMLLQHGAESTLVEQVSERLGLALGADSVEISISANAIVLSTLSRQRCITTTRRNVDRGINMQVVTAVQHTMIMAERGLLSIGDVRKRLDKIKPLRYPRGLVVLMVGLSCASFSHLSGGDAAVFALTFVASTIAMLVRQELAHRHFNPLVNFCVTAFVASSIASLGISYQIGNLPSLPMASSVLLLVPGFPLINALSDMVKGHVNMGLARWTMATLLTFATCAGIVLAMALWDVRGWS